MKLSYLITAFAALGVSSQALANPYNYPYNRDYGSYDHYGDEHDWTNRDLGLCDRRNYQTSCRNYERRVDRNNPERVIVPLIGGIVIGAIIASASKRDRYEDSEVVYRQRAPRRYVYDRRCDCYR